MGIRRSQIGRGDIARDANWLRPFLPAIGGDTYRVRVSADDTTPDYLEAKVTSADGSVVVAVVNDGADEGLDLSVAVYVAAEIADHAADPDAHHAPVTQGYGIIVTGQQVAVDTSVIAELADLHSAVTLSTAANANLLSLSGQQIGLDTQSANVIFAGPSSGGAATPAFRALVDADIPAAIARDSEVTAAIATHAALPNAHHNRQHSITSSSDHTVTGAALDVVGLTATNTLGILTPNADPTAAALLRSDTDGRLGLEGLGILTAPDGDYLKVASGVAVGLANSAAGRFVFTDDTVDQVALLDAVYLVGSNTPDANTGAIVQVIDGNFAVSANGASGGINSFVYSSTADHIPTFRGRKSLGTRSSPTAVGSGTVLARFGGAGWNGSAFPTESTAYIEMRSTQTHSGSAAGSHIRFGVTPDDSTTAVEVARLEGAGRLLIAETSNAHQTIGVTINMATNTNEAITLKQNNVAHGMTGVTDTNVFGAISIRSGTQGGMVMSGYHEGTTGVEINGAGVTDLTGKAAASEAYIHLNALKKSGSGVTTPGTGANLVAIRKNGSTVAIFAEDGDLYLDTVVNTDSWDAHNDMELLNGLRAAMVPDGHELRRRFGQFMTGARAVLESTGVVTFNEDGHLFVASKKLQMLTIDALRQKHERDTELIGQLTRRIEQLEMVVNG